MKICYITDLFPPEDKGGAERIAYYEARMMAASGHNVVVITSARKNIPRLGAYQVESKDGIKIYYFSPTNNLGLDPFLEGISLFKKTLLMALSLYNPNSHYLLKRILEKENPDIVHAHHSYFISYGALRAANSKKRKLILTFHVYLYECPKGGLLRKGIFKEKLAICNNPLVICGVRNLIFKKILPKPLTIIAINKFMKDRLEEKGFKNVVYLPNGIPFPERHDGFSQKRSEILYVGRLSKAKGVHLLIESFNQLRPPGFILRIIGDGEDRDYLERIAHANRNIVFMGKLPHDKLPNFYQNCYLVVVPSIWYEGMNTVVCEAMSFGKPVVGSDVPGHRNTILEGQTGLLFKVGDQSELTICLRRLLENPQLADEMGQRARARIETFSLTKHFENLLKIYESCLHS